MPSEYEIVTHGQNWTTRPNRNSVFEQNPSSAPNLWFQTYRDNTALQADDWERFRDPDQYTYRMYVNAQAEAESRVHGILEQYAALGADSTLAPGWVETLATVYTPSRYPVHGFQQIEAYIGYLAPTSYVTNTAGLSTADFLRRVTTIAYRTRGLQQAQPNSGIGTDRERQLWETHTDWQPTRKAVETALATYDWGEAFTALNLVLLPTLDDVLTRQFGEIARDNGDELAWLLQGFLDHDNQRRNRWSKALAAFAIGQRPATAKAIAKWVAKWSPIADAAAHGIATMLAATPEHPRDADDVSAAARRTREAFVDELLEPAEGASVP
ncbi:toluene monooxygenase system protein E [Nocardia transvalensis]|uniref:propane 2-monooxygenase n=1 Tax=Nocardia transvalensis TaxID=37333 RepID=A0A7W9PJ19_9NOCA|nr:toluene hydroxylase [Nocardia transvalensis]MBB5916618.1 toluene monooxygenase system protein E [Nocardia transvalensis]